MKAWRLSRPSLCHSPDLGEACKLVGIQFFLSNQRMHVLEGLYYIMPAALFFMMLCSAAIEFRSILRLKLALHIVNDNPGTFLLASSLGFVVNVLSYAVVKLTSSVTFKVRR